MFKCQIMHLAQFRMSTSVTKMNMTYNLIKKSNYKAMSGQDQVNLVNIDKYIRLPFNINI